MNKLHNPHDRYFRSSMCDLRVAREFFDAHLPKALRSQLNMDSLKLQAESFIDNSLKQSIVDILYSVQLNHEKAYLYVLTEHQAKSEYYMAFRLTKYIFQIMDRHISNPEHKILPVVIPLVLYNGGKPYSQPVDIFELFGDQRLLALETLYKPFTLIDVTQIDDNELRQREWSGIMEFVMKHIRERDFRIYFKQILKMLGKHNFNQAEHFVLKTMNYIMYGAELEYDDEIVKMVISELSPSLGEKSMTLAENLIQKGRQEGRQEGCQKGRQEEKIAIAKKLLAQGAEISFVASVTGVALEQVELLL